MEHVPNLVGSVPYSTEYVTRATYNVYVSCFIRYDNAYITIITITACMITIVLKEFFQVGGLFTLTT